MRAIRASLLAGAALAVIAGSSGWARAQSPQLHVMTVRVPGGGTAEIRYTGSTPPQVTVDAAPAGFAAMPSLFDMEAPFAEFDRIAAAMDRQAAALLRETGALAAQDGAGLADNAALPPGGSAYTFVSALSGNGVCMRSTEITATGDGPPRVVSRSSGNCGPAGSAGSAVGLPGARPQPVREPDAIMTRTRPAAPAHRPDMIMTKAGGARPYAHLVNEIPVSDR